MEHYRDAIRQIMIAVNVIDGAYALGAKKIGIKENTLSLLYALDDGKAHSQKEICDHWLIPKTTMNTIVQECVQEGYLTLAVSSGKKEKEICLTEKGKTYARTILSQLYRLEEQAMKRCQADFSLEFVQAIEQFAAYLKDETEQFIPMEREKNERY